MNFSSFLNRSPIALMLFSFVILWSCQEGNSEKELISEPKQKDENIIEIDSAKYESEAEWLYNTADSSFKAGNTVLSLTALTKLKDKYKSSKVYSKGVELKKVIDAEKAATNLKLIQKYAGKYEIISPTDPTGSYGREFYSLDNDKNATWHMTSDGQKVSEKIGTWDINQDSMKLTVSIQGSSGKIIINYEYNGNKWIETGLGAGRYLKRK